MKGKILLLVLSFSACTIFAQKAPEKKPYYHTSIQNLQKRINGDGDDNTQRSVGQTGTGANIDVKYHRCEWTIDPNLGRYIAGKVTTYFVTTAGGVNSITFDLNKTSFNNVNLSVAYHGSTTGVTTSFPLSGYTDILTINLPVTLSLGVLDSVSITYAGAPPAVNNQAEGYQQKGTGTNKYIYTLSESYEDKDWWPCKADMQDKIESSDYILTVPSAFTGVANGKLMSTVTSGANRIFTYHHGYPIASYLVAVGVAKYTTYNRGTVNISGTLVPVDYNVLTSHGTPTAELTAMDFCKLELAAFSAKYGDYGFKDEKYGMYEFGWGGGMEHQTNSAMSFGVMSDWGVIAHELAHQWWGDKVTFSTWNHLWLAEGFARYSEALAAELVPSLGQSAATTRSGFKSVANNATNQSSGCIVPASKSSSSNLLWTSTYGTTVYERGAMVVSMLRALLGDTKFFQACRNYQNDPALAYKSAVTDDLKAHMNAQAGVGASSFDLTPFFTAFASNGGFPTTTVNWWNPSGNILNLAIASQTRTAAGSTTYFPNVIPLRIQGGAGKDTVIVIYDINGNSIARAGNGISTPTGGNFLSITDFPWKPTSVTFDPYFQTLSNGSTVNTTVLDLRVLDFTVRANGTSNDATLVLDNNTSNTPIILERSADGSSFNVNGTMDQLAATSSDKRYFLRDASPLNGANYYRAKFKNASGEYVYSKTIKIGTEISRNFSLLNNPVQAKIQLANASGSVSNTYKFSIYDAAGKLISVSQKKVQGDITEIPVTNLAQAVYLLEIRSENDEVQTLKFIIK